MKKVILLVITLLLCNALFAQKLVVNNNKPERTEWFRDLGLGMFIHWSLDVQLGSVISHSLVGASEEYCNDYFALQHTFNPQNFNPDNWAKLAKLAGFKYVVFTTKHHNGFCMFDTRTTDFSIMHTPLRRDVTREVIEAFRKQGLAIGLYYGPEDWHFLHGQGILISRNSATKANPEHNPELNTFLKKQLKELLTNYGKIDIIFLDGLMGTPFLNTEFAAYCWELQPDIVVTRGAMETPEQAMPAEPIPGAWEACYTLGTQWQYKPTNETYKSGTTLIQMLVETRAKGGNLLLNIGPKADGSIAPEQENILRELALWMMVNKQSVIATRPNNPIKQDHIYFTKSKDGKILFATVTGIQWKYGERREFLLKGIRAGENTKVSILGHNGKVIEYRPGTDAKVYWENTQQGLKVSAVRGQRLYNNTRWPNPVVIKIENRANR